VTITTKQIDLWRAAASETETLEFKEAKNQFDSAKLLEYCVAISNECGGHLILGVTNTPPREVVGTSAFQNPAKTAEKLLQSLGFRVDIHEVPHPAGRVVVFEIPSRPKGTPRQINGQYFMRCGESLVAMTPDQLRKIFDEGKPDWLEEQAAENLPIAEVIRLLNIQKFFDLIGLPYPTDQYGVVERLANERLIDRVDNDRYSIRNMGALLLPKKLDKFTDLALRAPRVVVYTGKSKVETKLDVSGTMGYAVAFSGLVSWVMTQIPQNEIIKNALRKEVKLVPEIVIREIVANAIIHQDFTTTGARISVDVYDNRIEISNPGVPIIAAERFIDCYKSRNERLADFMRRLGICEEKGSGIDKVVKTAEFCQLPAPSFTTDGIRTQVTIFGPVEIDEMDRADRIRACYQHCCLKYVMSERMTNQSLRARFALPESKSAIVSQAIAATVDEGKVKLDEKVGTSRRFARYVPYWA
jgi:ATP-dependent DNA helicase RecG